MATMPKSIIIVEMVYIIIPEQESIVVTICFDYPENGTNVVNIFPLVVGCSIKFHQG